LLAAFCAALTGAARAEGWSAWQQLQLFAIREDVVTATV
jgi:hypothetical protein